MGLAQLIPIVIKISVVLLVFALGLNATLRDAGFLFRRPGLLFRSLLSLNIVMLGVAIVIVSNFELPAAVKIAIIALSVSPVPPLLPKRAIKTANAESYGIGLLVAAALCAMILVPVSVALLGRLFGTGSHMPIGSVAVVVVTVVLAPVVAGIAFRHFAPAIATRIAGPFSLLATILLALAILPVLVNTSGAVWGMLGRGLFWSLILFALIGLAVGHFLGGPNPDDRTVLALASSTRHPGVALAIAGLNFPDHKAVLAVLICHLIIGSIVAIPYMNWRKRSRHSNALHARI